MVQGEGLPDKFAPFFTCQYFQISTSINGGFGFSIKKKVLSIYFDEIPRFRGKSI